MKRGDFLLEKKQFLTILRDELIARGFTPERAERHVRSLSLTLDADDIQAIEQMNDSAEIALLAEGIANFKGKTAEKKPAEQASDPKDDTASDETADDAGDDDVKVYAGGKAIPDSEPFDEQEEPPTVVVPAQKPESEDAPVPPTPRGKRTFWTVFCCTLPITAVLLALFYLLFGAAFATLCALIAGLFAALIGGVAIGTTVSLVGIIYGIVQLVTAISTAPGLYEIGLGLTVAGCVMLGGILLYNCAIRLIPWLIRKLSVFFRFSRKKLKLLFNKAKEACYKL